MTDDQRREIHESVGSLHAFVDLFDRVRGERIRGLRLLIGLNIADVATTALFLALGGAEGNPVVAPIVTRWWLVVLVKGTILCFVARGVLRASPRSASTRRMVDAALVYYSAVVVWNLWVILHLV